MSSRYNILTGNVVEHSYSQPDLKYSPINALDFVDRSIIVGSRRSGKTTRLVNELSTELRDQSNTRIVYMGTSATQMDQISRGIEGQSRGRVIFCTERSLATRVKGIKVHSIYVDDINEFRLGGPKSSPSFVENTHILLTILKPCISLKKIVTTCCSDYLPLELRYINTDTVNIFGFTWNIHFL